MKSPKAFLSVLLTFTLVFIAAGVPLAPRPAQASYEDAAVFYDELGQHGSWVDYEQYGPVWYPNQVQEDWRPYTNGRWTPSEQGYLFETNEPWGWATYHYGNWMPTENYGWVWVPGRTWYPNTVAWRNSPENAPVDTSYIGWAPIPPPNYVPPPAYAPPGYGGGYPGYGGGYPGSGGSYPGYGGYGGGGSVLDLLTAPFWIFSQASRFLLGFGQPYSPGYSYSGCGCLAPPTYVRVIYPTTTIIRSWYSPSYYQPDYFGGSSVLGAYSWGPPVRYVSRVTNVQYVTINNYIKRVHVNNVRGGWPDRVVFNRNPHLRKIVPVEDPVRLARFRPREVRNMDQAVRHLGNPRAIVQPAGISPLDRARIPKARAAAFTGERPARVRGMELPRRAQQQFTPQMEERLKQSRPAAAEGPGGPSRPERRGQWVVPGGPQQGVVAGPEGARRPGRGQPEAVEGQRGVKRGPGEGPPTSQGMRRGPVEGFQGPAERGVRRGPGAGPETSQGMRRGPVEGFQGPGERGVRRGPVEAPEGARGVRRGPVEGFQGPGPQGVRRGPAEGFQPQQPQRRQEMQQQQQMRQQQEQQRRQEQMRQQQEQQRRQQMQRQPQEQLRREQMRQQQESQRRQQMQQQQEQQRRQQMQQQSRQQQEQQRRQQMQQQQQQMMRQQQEQQRRQQQQMREQREQQGRQEQLRQQQQRKQQQEQERRQKMRQQQEQSRVNQMRQQQEQSRRQQVRQTQETRRAQQVQRQKRERPQQHSQNQGDRRGRF